MFLVKGPLWFRVAYVVIGILQIFPILLLASFLFDMATFKDGLTLLQATSNYNLAFVALIVVMETITFFAYLTLRPRGLLFALVALLINLYGLFFNSTTSLLAVAIAALPVSIWIIHQRLTTRNLHT